MVRRVAGTAADRRAGFGGRFYLLQMCDMWTDVFDSPGKRTTGTSAQVLAIAGPGWQGQLPAEATLIQNPTAIGWIIGRTQTNGKADYDAVHKFQAGLIATPLSQWGKPYQPPAGKINPDWDMATPPITQVETLGPAEYFSLFANSPRSTRRMRTTIRSFTRCGASESSRASPSRSTGYRLKFSAP